MTRMWMIPAELMCDRHLLGEHNEIHKAIGGIERGHSIAGYTTAAPDGVVKLTPFAFGYRHLELANEMAKRWPATSGEHRSPLPDDWPDTVATLPMEQQIAFVDVNASLVELRHRCPACRAMIDKYFDKLNGAKP